MLVAASVQAQPPPSIAFEVPPPGTLSGPSRTVYGIAQDAAGYLWFASEEGLHRYDGVEFVAFRADPDDPGAIPGNRVTGVAAAPDGAVWAFVDRFGLVRYRPETGRLDRFRLPPGLSGNTSLAVDGDGQVWLRVNAPVPSPGQRRYVGRRVRFDPATRRVFVAPTPDDVRRVQVDRSGRAWVQTDTALYRRRKAGGWARYPVPGASVWVEAAVPTLLVGERLLRYDAGADAFRPLPDPHGLVARIGGVAALVDREGLVWARGADDALVVLDLASGRAERYLPDALRPDAVPDAPVTGLFEDSSGVVWLASAYGLRTVAPGWRTFRAERLAPSPFTYHLAESPTGRVWGGTACGAVWRLDATGRRVPLADAAPAVARSLAGETAARGYCAAGVTEAPDGAFWFAGWPFGNGRVGGVGGVGGVVRIAPDGRVTRFAAPDGRPHAARLVHLDRTGTAWAATEEGLVGMRPDGSTRTFTADTDGPGRLPATIVWTVGDAPGGDLWVGTYGGGLVRFDPARGRVRRVYAHDPDDAATLSSGIVTAVATTPADPGALWVGTYDGGLNRLDLATGRVRRMTRRDGLPDLAVKSLLVDARGDLWVGTGGGLVWLHPTSGETRVYTEADGLPGLAFGLYDAARLAGGRFAAIVGGALLTFDPAAVRPSTLDAAVVLRRLRVAGVARALPPLGEAVRLRPGERSLGVEVAALSFAAPAGLRYAVRLDGVDEAWTPLGGDRTAAWSRLPPGRFTLRARAATGSGQWSRRVLVVPVVVEPEWWQRGAVRGGALGLLLVGFTLAVREVSQRRLRRQVGALEAERASARRVHAERERISRDLHDHVGAQLSSLLAGVDLARLARDRGRATAADPLDAIETDARETIRQLRETIWALHHESMTVDAFCERLRADAARLLRGRSAPAIRVDCGDCGGVELSPMQALHLYRIAQEAVTNAVKHAGASRITVDVACEAGRVTVAVADDGTFRAPSGGHGASGDGAAGLSGYGLGSMHARALSIGATLALSTSDGTRVTVDAPLDAVTAPARHAR